MISPIQQPFLIKEVLDVPLSKENSPLKMGTLAFAKDNITAECVIIYPSLSKLMTGGTIPVRIHSACITSEVFGSDRCDCAWQLRHALNLLEARQSGILIYLPGHEGRGTGLFSKLESFLLMDQGICMRDCSDILGVPFDVRNYWPAIAVLKRFNIRSIELITNNPDKIAAVNTGGIRVERRIPTVMQPTSDFVHRYLVHKREHCGHLL